MTTRRRLLPLLAVGLLAAALYAILRSQAEPTYQGRSLSSWLDDLDKDVSISSLLAPRVSDPNAERDPYQNTVKAVRQIGTNALPFLLSWIRYQRLAWYGTLDRFLQNVKIPWAPGRNKAFRAERAVIGFHILGQQAAAAIPELTRLMNDSTQPACAWRSMHALSAFGERAIPPLVSLFTNQTRATELRFYAVSRIQLMGTNARTAAPVFLELLNDADPATRNTATNTLRRIAPELLTNAPPQ